VDRELLLEIGCEELPASWLPALTNQIGKTIEDQLREHRLPAEAPAETFSTPRRLTVRIVRVPERQTDLEELVNGPPVAAAFPKLMRWDAAIDDGRGELLFGRPIRWLLFVYGGRVVPFTIVRSTAAQTAEVQEVSTGAITFGHRFLTTSGRAGRAIKVRTFEEYRARLLENFVILERSERHNKIARELDAKALRLKGRVSHVVHSDSGLLQEVPDLVEYPSVIAGTFAQEFLDLPQEVVTTTLIHHQHYFPVEGEDGKLRPAFLAVINTEPDNERSIARNAERVVTARLRDALFFWATWAASTRASKGSLRKCGKRSTSSTFRLASRPRRRRHVRSSGRAR
jgi:glycyl-tRNA synthetase beta chain